GISVGANDGHLGRDTEGLSMLEHESEKLSMEQARAKKPNVLVIRKVDQIKTTKLELKEAKARTVQMRKRSSP
ncbi:hypothetical protein HAX54_020060, partial [Datura stramonium]|nr:hypothetical protein [Datura stramonium]